MKACSKTLTHVEMSSALPGLQVDFAKKDKTAQLKGDFTADGVKTILLRKDQYAANMIFPFLASYSGRSTRFTRFPDFTRVNVQ